MIKIYGNAWHNWTKAHYILRNQHMLLAVQSVLPTASLQCCRKTTEWRHQLSLIIPGRHVNSLDLGPVYMDSLNLRILLVGWSYFLDCHFFLRTTTFPTLSLLTSWQIGLHPCTSDVAVNFADCVLENCTDVESKFSLTLWPQPVEIGRMCLLGAIPHTNNVGRWGLP